NSRFVQKAFDSLIADLKKRGFRILPRTFEDSFRIMSNRYTIYSANIYLRSIDSVSQLYGILKNEKYLGGAYLVGQAQNESDCRKNLYKKILEKATAKAKMMAGSSKRKIAGVMSITENKSDEDNPEGGWIVYQSLSAPRMSDLPRGAATALSVPDSIANESDIIQFYPIHASFTIRFSLE
ncbi:MAG TPA: hypothetical protein VFV08_03675, partial [Puia sp.]|nr:hypothetical protein [Puia sp.]